MGLTFHSFENLNIQRVNLQNKSQKSTTFGLFKTAVTFDKKKQTRGEGGGSRCPILITQDVFTISLFHKCDFVCKKTVILFQKQQATLKINVEFYLFLNTDSCRDLKNMPRDVRFHLTASALRKICRHMPLP